MPLSVPLKIPKVTVILIVISLVLALWSQFGGDIEKLQPFFISWYIEPTLPEIQSGQIWRLLTPIFVHFGLLHLSFNMIMTWQLGQIIEWRYGPWKLAWMVVVIGIPSNLAEYLFSGPGFGGMSGVIYGLFGYFWIASKVNPQFGLQINPAAVRILLVWFVLCWFDFFGLLGEIKIANWAHSAGLLMGMALAFVDSRRTKKHLG